MQPYRKDALTFAFCAIAAALFAAAQPVILGGVAPLLRSYAGLELLAVPLVQAVICALCSVLLLRTVPVSRLKHLVLAGACVAVVAAILLRGWGLLAVFLAVPTIVWAYNLKRVGA